MSPNPVAHTRQRLTERRSATVTALIDAGLEELREHGHDQLSIRSVANRAGVTHTTAYSYFTSKAHLVAEIYWRRLDALPRTPPDSDAPLADRVTGALQGAALIVGDDADLAQAALSALLSSDLEVRRLRDAIGANLLRRVVDAVGPDEPPELVDALILAFSGAMLQAGMGYFGYAEVIERMSSLARLLSTTESSTAP